MIRGASRESLAHSLDGLEAVLDTLPSAAERIRFAEDLFAVASLLDAGPALRRALTDPSRDGHAKAALARRLLDRQVGRDALDLVSGTVRRRWAQARDLPDAVESMATTAVLAAAEAGERLGSVEDELFRFQRIILGDRELFRALAEDRAPAASRAVLVDRLLDGRSAPETAVLVRRIVAAPRGRSVVSALDAVLEAAARRQERLIAHVTAAVPLTQRQQSRLAALLADRYGRAMVLEVDVEPSVVGGLRVQVGDEVLDGTLSRRLATAAERLTT